MNIDDLDAFEKRVIVSSSFLRSWLGVDTHVLLDLIDAARECQRLRAELVRCNESLTELRVYAPDPGEE